MCEHLLCQYFDKIKRFVSWFNSQPGHFGLFSGKTVYSILPQSTQLQKWLPSINKAVLRACALYAASCSGISPGGLKWFLCVQAC